MITPVLLSILRAVFDNMRGRVTYDLGAKAVDLSADSHEIHAIDCSGFVRFAVYRATNGGMLVPDGSWAQREWCAAAGLHEVRPYSNVALPAVKKDLSRLFLAFMAPGAEGPGASGHVWFVIGGRTMESHGGKGVDSRPWNAGINAGRGTLASYCSACYELPARA